LFLPACLVTTFREFWQRNLSEKMHEIAAKQIRNEFSRPGTEGEETLGD
jgi:hypothetical protein